MRKLLPSLLFILTLFCAGFAHAQSGIGSLPQSTYPLNGVDNLWLNQGSGCSTNTTPCTATQTPSIYLGQPVQTTCASIGTPFQYQMCINNTSNPPVLQEYVGTRWWPLFNLSTSTGPVFIGPGGGGGGGINFSGRTVVGNYSILPTDNGAVFNNFGATGSATLTLPPVAPNNGKIYCFNVASPQTIVVQPSGADSIVLGQAVGNAGASMQSNTQNSSVCLIADNITQWVATNAPDGVWTVNGAATFVPPTALSYIPLNPNNNLFDVASVSASRTNLGLGSIATQNANAVAITGGAISGINPILAATTFAGLPAIPTAGQLGYITDGKASNCGDASCTTFGTTVTGGTGALKLMVWYNGTNWTLTGK